ncbi:MAG: hypothetical protein ACI8P3_003590 [Saprospiraceae bacterium]|jgi:hypothetical protein
MAQKSNLPPGHDVERARQIVKKLSPFSEGEYEKKVMWPILRESFLVFFYSLPLGISKKIKI